MTRALHVLAVSNHPVAIALRMLALLIAVTLFPVAFAFIAAYQLVRTPPVKHPIKVKVMR